MSVSAFNRRWAAVILEALTRHGVQHICIAPGSRSTPLTLAAAENRAFIHHTHFDERGLGHLALGLAKASRQPVAVIVTSGTAAANLYPALIEAGLTGEKLILLTADRPPELIDCGANQAIRQPGMFASHPAQTISLPRPSQDIPARWLVSTIDQALGALHAGGVHINCPFAEPLYGDMDETGVEWQQQLGNWWQSDKPWLRQALQLESEKQRDWFFWRQKRGVVVAGRMSAAEGKKVAEWAQTLGWPLIGDVLSQTGQPLPCADLWLGNGKAVSELAQAQIVVQLGSSLTGKRVLQWQATCEPDEYWLVFLHGFSGDRNEWRKVGDAFPAWPRLYLDLPGHGGSADIAVQDFAGVNTLLQSMFNSYNIHKYWLIGYSLGGRVAMNFASQPRAGMRGLIVEGGHPGLQDAEARQARRSNDSAWAERFRREPLEQVFADWYQQPVFASLNAAQRESLVALRSRNNGATLAAMLQATSLAAQADLRASLQARDFPFHYLCGERDAKFRAIAQTLAADLHLIHHAGHNAHRDNPAAVIACLAQILAS